MHVNEPNHLMRLLQSVKRYDCFTATVTRICGLGRFLLVVRKLVLSPEHEQVRTGTNEETA